MSIPRNLRYTRDHEWARVESENLVFVGVTEYAAEHLGDIVYIDVPQAGEDLNQNEPFGTIESTKSVSDLMAPITGVVLEGNTLLLETPQIINEDPYGDGWIMKVNAESLDELDELMSATEYEEYLGELDED